MLRHDEVAIMRLFVKNNFMEFGFSLIRSPVAQGDQHFDNHDLDD